MPFLKAVNGYGSWTPTSSLLAYEAQAVLQRKKGPGGAGAKAPRAVHRAVSGSPRGRYRYSMRLIISSEVTLLISAANFRIFSPIEQRWSGRTIMPQWLTPCAWCS